MSTASGPPARSPAPAEDRAAGLSRSKGHRPPPALLELLRMLVVVFFAGAGFQIGGTLPDGAVLGALDGTAVAVVIGSGIGYVLGGVLGRSAALSAETARHSLRDV